MDRRESKVIIYYFWLTEGPSGTVRGGPGIGPQRTYDAPGSGSTRGLQSCTPVTWVCTLRWEVYAIWAPFVTETVVDPSPSGCYRPRWVRTGHGGRPRVVYRVAGPTWRGSDEESLGVK